LTKLPYQGNHQIMRGNPFLLDLKGECVLSCRIKTHNPETGFIMRLSLRAYVGNIHAFNHNYLNTKTTLRVP
jgi:hypothetical protein